MSEETDPSTSPISVGGQGLCSYCLLIHADGCKFSGALPLWLLVHFLLSVTFRGDATSSRTAFFLNQKSKQVCIHVGCSYLKHWPSQVESAEMAATFAAAIPLEWHIKERPGLFENHASKSYVFQWKHMIWSQLILWQSLVDVQLAI